MKLSDLPDIEFVSADEQEILSDIIKLYTGNNRKDPCTR